MKAVIISQLRIKSQDEVCGSANHCNIPKQYDGNRVVLNYLKRLNIKTDLVSLTTNMTGFDIKTLDSYDIIFVNYSCAGSLANVLNLDMIRGLCKNIEKVVRIYTDPDQVYVMTMSLRKDLVKLASNSFNRDRYHIKNKDDAIEYDKGYRDLLSKTHCIMTFLCNQDEDEVERTFEPIFRFRCLSDVIAIF